MPAFMPVGTQASVKGLEIEQLRATGAEMVLGNTYHLSLRPGEEVVASLGGMHRFMGWDGPILTDSGGFQLYSLAHLIKVTEEEAVFRSHIDGRLVALSPERAVAIQEALGSDVAMVLDHVVGLPNSQLVVPTRWSDPSAGLGAAAMPPGGPIKCNSPSFRAGSTRNSASPAPGNCGSWISPATRSGA